MNDPINMWVAHGQVHWNFTVSHRVF